MDELDNNNNPSSRNEQWPKEIGRWFAALASATGGLVVFYALYQKFGVGGDWWALAQLVVSVFIAFSVAALIRFALSPLVPYKLPASSAVNPETVMRSRIAPLVLGLGGIAIVVLALGIILSFSILASQKPELWQNIDTLLTGIFSAVLPVFATWVGTVIAFYFTNESYRQAAQATREAAEGVESKQPRVTERMIPYEKISKIEMERAKVRTVMIADIVAKMQQPVTRVIIFDKTRQPVFVIRRRRIPNEWLKNPTTHTVDEYLNLENGANAIDATQFGYVPQTATLDEARTAIREANSVDVFVTATGQKTEPVLGWLTDTQVKS